MITNVFLIRHGQTDSNVTGFAVGWSNEDLNRVGYTQVRRLSSRLAKLPISVVYTSPLQRTFSTASVLAEPHRLEPKVLDDLIELRLGDWEGLHVDEIERRWGELWQQSMIDPSELTVPNGEGLNEVAERAVRAFNMVVEANEGKHALIVAHEVVVKVLVAHVLGVPNSIYRGFEIGNASLSVIRVANGDSQLTTINDTSHLEGLWQL